MMVKTNIHDIDFIYLVCIIICLPKKYKNNIKLVWNHPFLNRGVWLFFVFFKIELNAKNRLTLQWYYKSS